MANIMILGDTWGIVPSHIWSSNKNLVNWFEYAFLKRGHATFNKSRGGNQNHDQLLQAEIFLNATKGTAFELDLIIWFHTELIRDMSDGHDKAESRLFLTKHYDEVIDIVGERMYKHVTDMKNQFPNTKWAILGGHAPLLSTKKHMLDWAEFRIDNLRSKFLGVDVPESQAFEFLERGKGSLWDWPGISEEVIQRELQIKEQIIELTKDKNIFYNQKHPALGPLTDLADEIINHFKL